VDLDRLNADFAAAGAYKWLLGPIGIGFCYIQPELLERLQPALVGAGSVKNYRDFFHYDLKFALNSRRFEESSVSLLDIAAFAAAADLIQEVGIERIERRVLDLGARLASGLAERGYELLPPWPRGSEESSGIVSFRKPGASPQEPMRDLTAAGVVGRVHADFVRLSPHFYNTEEEVDRVLSVLAPEHELRS
jgi:selenocysteine lyase/cysteine desulfurase